MLPAQRDRIDSMFLLQKTWPFDGVARALSRSPAGRHDRTAADLVRRRQRRRSSSTGGPTDVQGAAIEHGKTAEITPLASRRPRASTRSRRGGEGSRSWGSRQPFKQAHREVYLLTDAERNTRTYSNRFAAHIIRQHQFNALCAARGLEEQAAADGRRYLSAGDPRAAASGGCAPSSGSKASARSTARDTNDAGVYLRLATDQVRFYRIDAAQN